MNIRTIVVLGVLLFSANSYAASFFQWGSHDGGFGNCSFAEAQADAAREASAQCASGRVSRISGWQKWSEQRREPCNPTDPTDISCGPSHIEICYAGATFSCR